MDTTTSAEVKEYDEDELRDDYPDFVRANRRPKKSSEGEL